MKKTTLEQFEELGKELRIFKAALFKEYYRLTKWFYVPVLKVLRRLCD